MVLGGLEAAQPGLVFRHSAASEAFYTLRLAAGLMMFIASLRWLRSTAACSLRRERRAETPVPQLAPREIPS